MRSIAKQFVLAGAVAVVTTLGTVSQAAEDPAALIEYRQAIMKAIDRHILAIVMAVKGDVSFTDEIAGHARAINEMSKNLPRLFPQGSGKEAGETRALPVIWQRWDEFEANIKTLQTESAKLVEVATGGDRAAITKQTMALGNDGCGSCHKTFREKKN